MSELCGKCFVENAPRFQILKVGQKFGIWAQIFDNLLPVHYVSLYLCVCKEPTNSSPWNN